MMTAATRRAGAPACQSRAVLAGPAARAPRPTRGKLVITAFLPSGVAPAPGSVLDGKTLLAKKDARNKAAIAADDAALAFRAKLTVKLQCRLDLGGQWKLVGSSPELGRWTPEIAPTMTWSEGDVWSTTLTLRPGRHYFKAVMRRADGCYVYEDAPERYVDIPDSPDVLEATLDTKLPQGF